MAQRRSDMRFPDIVWYCDRCNACLSDQPGFDDNEIFWECAECGHMNEIAEENIMGIDWGNEIDEDDRDPDDTGEYYNIWDNE